jgi:3-oxoacyl-[acyl-carrier protein] reductase
VSENIWDGWNDMKIEFKDKVALVTGSTRGIGKQIADDIEDDGGEVFRTGKNNLDFTNKESIEKYMVYLSSIEKIDILVNNAGINELYYVGELDKDAIDEIIDVNLKGAMLMTNAIAPIMIKQKYGRIVNISSVLGSTALPARSIYCATKAGIIGFTRACAIELAKHNVLVNTVSPGFIRTELTKKILGVHGMNEKAREIPFGRLGLTFDVASAVCFLCSNLNTYITGTDLVVDGGYTIH